MQTLHFERRGDNRWENRLPAGQTGGRGRGSYPTTPQAIVENQGQSFGPPLSPPPHTSSFNNADVYFHGTPHSELSNTSSPRHPPRNHHTNPINNTDGVFHEAPHSALSNASSSRHPLGNHHINPAYNADGFFHGPPHSAMSYTSSPRHLSGNHHTNSVNNTDGFFHGPPHSAISNDSSPRPPPGFHHTDPVNNTDDLFHGPPHGALSNTFPRHPPGNRHTNPVNNTDGFFHGSPHSAMSNASSPRPPPGDHYTNPVNNIDGFSPRSPHSALSNTSPRPPLGNQHTNLVNNTDGFFHGPSHTARSNTPLARHPPRNHHHPHTQPPPMLSDYAVFNVGGNYNMEDVTQATQGGIGGPMAEAGSMQLPARALSPQSGPSDFSPIQRRRVESSGLPCPVSRCQSSLGRAQDQRRHLLTHLPHWVHCPAPECIWRGDRPDAFVRHWGSDHPSVIRVPNEDQCRTYDPQPLMRAISDGTLSIQAAQRHAISAVRRKASELQKPELFDNPWGSKSKKQRNSDPR